MSIVSGAFRPLMNQSTGYSRVVDQADAAELDEVVDLGSISVRRNRYSWS